MLLDVLQECYVEKLIKDTQKNVAHQMPLHQVRNLKRSKGSVRSKVDCNVKKREKAEVPRQDFQA